MTELQRLARTLADSHILVSDGHYTLAVSAVLTALKDATDEVIEAMARNWAGEEGWSHVMETSKDGYREAMRASLIAGIDNILGDGK